MINRQAITSETYESMDIDTRLSYLECLVGMYNSTRSAPSARDACLSIWNCFAQEVPLDKLFCATEENGGKIRFLAFIDSGEIALRHKRNLKQGEIIEKVIRDGVPLSSTNSGSDSKSIHMSPELQDNWILVPITLSTGKNIGVLGGCNESEEYSERHISLLRIAANEIAGILKTTYGMHQAILKERKRLMEGAWGSPLHNFKGHLGTIPPYIDELRTILDCNDNEVKEILGRIEETAQRIRTEAREKLDEVRHGFLRTSQKESVNVSRLIQTVVSTVQTKWPRVEMDLRLKGQGPFVQACQQDLYEVFMNLVRNAVQAMEGSPTKRITFRIASLDESAGKWVKIEVEDTGRGIPEEFQGEIWQLDYSTKSPPGGFGLYRTKNLIEEYGGSIEVAESKVDVGTTIEIKLPAKEVGF